MTTEGGFRIHAGPFDLQTSVYRMYLVDELHFSPITFANVNLDPTLRYGVENTVSYRITEFAAAERNGQLHAGDVPQRPVCRQ